MSIDESLQIIEARIRDAEFLTQKAPALAREENQFELDTEDELFNELMRSDQVVDDTFVNVDGLSLEKQLSLVEGKFQQLIKENKVFRDYLTSIEPYKQDLGLMKAAQANGRPSPEAKVVVDALDPDTLLSFTHAHGVDEIKSVGELVPESASKVLSEYSEMALTEDHLERLSNDVAILAVRSARVLEKYVSEMVIEPNERLGELDEKRRTEAAKAKD
ncbi:hypothetical protein B0I72DRAFT_34880 [Yarrowia lipolytica]|jgi:hypothetical protein|uniref:YALI0E20295p n=2 Tax=Yarrowia lipolytica TaxID=4952 RepID=Q6C580_YARLI|nr:YALI0E20295p [Yarrowia lipolytica CLIB122]AOW05694.1 hypothetical protein YALI1_E24128g [Yarrowia lipolytica]KAB8281620.1 hypothetical protein BKA91DRAFT_32148 [Yarrowia lipolytica]KAE8171030.1 hypothetical protein BKA90DRAFT_30740 [Yarrowia lipolytica]KAJ8057154.1 hypothetical protein LXG23DRAFT_53857 [Yarrowia lipolytica]QNQ00047.1 Hypothetical protein YALI2_E01362g [Yarrowia lipolytica]|eukprot:XP_504182.1 YALI0E20295p [Yarrowia lipolytica CLIB122]